MRHAGQEGRREAGGDDILLPAEAQVPEVPPGGRVRCEVCERRGVDHVTLQAGCQAAVTPHILFSGTCLPWLPQPSYHMSLFYLCTPAEHTALPNPGASAAYLLWLWLVDRPHYTIDPPTWHTCRCYRLRLKVSPSPQGSRLCHPACAPPACQSPGPGRRRGQAFSRRRAQHRSC
jgi:hypothetical protein